jgi:hypothetical protein
MDKSYLPVFKSLVAGAMLASCAHVFAVAVDTDGDGVNDDVDNCPAVTNADQRNSDNLLPKAFASTTGWTSANGFGACSGIDTSTACMDGQALVFSYVTDTVSRSFVVSNPAVIQLSVDVSAYVGNGNTGNDTGSVTLNAYNSGDVLLDSAVWSSSALDGTVQNIKLALANTAAFPQVTRLEVVFTGTDNGGWGGNYGPRFANFSLVVDATGDACDDDDDNDGILDAADTFPTDPNIGTLSNKTGSVKKDSAGRAVAFAGDVNDDGYADYVVGIPGYDVPATPSAKIIKDAGRAEVISGKTGDVLMFVNGIAAKDTLGFAVAGGADVDGDGFNDVVVGAPKADNLTDPSNKLLDAGSVIVLHGEAGLPTRTIADSTIPGTEAKALFGSALALGDVDAVSGAEIIVGSPKADDLRDAAKKLADAGSVTVFNGSTLVALPDVYYGATAKAYAGTSVAAGNFDAAAGADIIIGAPKDDDTANKLADAGSVTVYGIADAVAPVMKKYGAAKSYLGTSVAAGNIDGVVGDEVLAGAPGDDVAATVDTKKVVDAGSATVFFADGAVLPVSKYGALAKAGLGNSVAAGDVDGDGLADIIVGASKDDKPGTKVIKDTGSVSVWSGSDYSSITKLYGSVGKDYFGTVVASGDINGDGWHDLMVGAIGYDLPAVKPAKPVMDIGSVQLFSGDAL